MGLFGKGADRLPLGHHRRRRPRETRPGRFRLVNVYFDTAVVVAACVAGHPHYNRAVEALRSVHAKETDAFISAHGLAECFSVLTRTPFIPPIFPNDAWQFLADNILRRFEIVTLSAKEYQDAIQRCSQNGWAGGRVYDVLHLDSAK